MVDLLSKFEGKKVFITGHTGFKGSWLSFLLDNYGAIVKGYSLPPNTAPSLFQKINFSTTFSSEYSDINDFKSLNNSIKNFSPDYIFHLAAQPLVIDSYHNPFETFLTNAVGTLNLLEILRKLESKASVIIVTTDKVYENLELNLAFKEDDKLGGNDPYSASKAVSEIITQSYCKSFFKKSGLKVASARAGNVIGGGDWSKDRLIPDIIRSYSKNQKLKIRNPLATRPWQHVLEPLNGYLKLALGINDQISFQGPWNFGPEINDVASVKEIVELAHQFGFVKNFEFLSSNFLEAKYLQLDNTKAQKLNWKPVWNSKKALERTLNWYKYFYNGISADKLIKDDLNEYERDEK